MKWYFSNDSKINLSRWCRKIRAADYHVGFGELGAWSRSNRIRLFTISPTGNMSELPYRTQQPPLGKAFLRHTEAIDGAGTRTGHFQLISIKRGNATQYLFHPEETIVSELTPLSLNVHPEVELLTVIRHASQPTKNKAIAEYERRIALETKPIDRNAFEAKLRAALQTTSASIPSAGQPLSGVATAPATPGATRLSTPTPHTALATRSPAPQATHVARPPAPAIPLPAPLSAMSVGQQRLAQGTPPVPRSLQPISQQSMQSLSLGQRSSLDDDRTSVTSSLSPEVLILSPRSTPAMQTSTARKLNPSVHSQLQADAQSEVGDIRSTMASRQSSFTELAPSSTPRIEATANLIKETQDSMETAQLEDLMASQQQLHNVVLNLSDSIADQQRTTQLTKQEKKRLKRKRHRDNKKKAARAGKKRIVMDEPFQKGRDDSYTAHRKISATETATLTRISSKGSSVITHVSETQESARLSPSPPLGQASASRTETFPALIVLAPDASLLQRVLLHEQVSRRSTHSTTRKSMLGAKYHVIFARNREDMLELKSRAVSIDKDTGARVRPFEPTPGKRRPSKKPAE